MQVISTIFIIYQNIMYRLGKGCGF